VALRLPGGAVSPCLPMLSPVEANYAFFFLSHSKRAKAGEKIFFKNDIIRYGAHGVCKIADIARKI